MSTGEFWTIGHSTHPLGEFVALLQANAIGGIADVRRFPHSRTNPQFNIETLPAALEAHGIAYCHIAALGGRRSRPPESGPSPNLFWENDAFRAYADYTATADFRSGLEELLSFGRARRCAVMCSEALWWRCHRRIVTDCLLARGARVVHILGNGKCEEAQLNAAAQQLVDGTLIYLAKMESAPPDRPADRVPANVERAEARSRAFGPATKRRSCR